MKPTKRCIIAGCFLLAGLLMWACSDKNGGGTAHLEVWLTDAPSVYQEVNIDIQEVRVNAGDDSESGWRSLAVNKGIYNLLDFTNGLDTLLAETDLPAGKISQVRLILGENNNLKVDDQIVQLTTPSAQQSGLKLQVHEVLKEGINYKILVDFDAARSIVSTGSGKYILKPVIRAVTKAEDGAIKGLVEPSSSSPVIYAIMGSDTVSTHSNLVGQFMFPGLPSGNYRLVFVPVTPFHPFEKTDVVVSIGSVTDVGTVTITE